MTPQEAEALAAATRDAILANEPGPHLPLAWLNDDLAGVASDLDGLRQHRDLDGWCLALCQGDPTAWPCPDARRYAENLRRRARRWVTTSGRRRTLREERDHLIAVAQVEAEKHQPDDRQGGCTCGFCAWSVEHVLVMSMREALEGVGLVVSDDAREAQP